MNHNHLINKAEFTWEKLKSGLYGLHENGNYIGVTKIESSYLDYDVEFYTHNNYDFDSAMLSLEDYAISIGLNVYLIDSGKSTSNQKWFRYIIK
jgi:hypothetical protein